MVFPPTLLTLIERLAGGGEEADWREFLRDYWGPVCRFARQRGSLTVDDAEDVASETLEAIVKNNLLARWSANRSAKLRTLICAVVRNILSNRARVETGRDRLIQDHRGQLDRYLAVAYLRSCDTSTDPLRELMLVASYLSPDPVHLVGEGDGARIALRFALEHPERVRSLVLSAPDPRWFASDADIGAARARASLRSSADTMLACRRLWRIQVPVLVITGEHDWRTSGDTPPLRCVRLVREQLLRGAGMLPHVQASQDFNRAVARFLERQRMSAGEP
jgi:pimeloyl-ACP methyl ester carboxylesterase